MFQRLRILLTVVLLVGLLVVWLTRQDPAAAIEAPRFSGSLNPPLDSMPAVFGAERLEGRLVDPDERPLVDALVAIEDQSALAFDYTDAQGHFRLEGLRPGMRELLLVAEGFAPQRFELAVPSSEPLLLTSAARRAPIESLPPLLASPLGGVVSLVPAVALAGYEILLEPLGDPLENGLAGRFVRRVSTDAAGAFSVDKLAHGRYQLQLLPPWAHGGSWPLLLSQELEHHSEQQLALRAESGELWGRLFDSGGRTLAGALVLLSESADESHVWEPRASDEQGGYRFTDLPAGSYRVLVRAGQAEKFQELVLGPGERLEVRFEALVPR